MNRAGKCAAVLFIAVYFGVLSFGVIGHALKVGVGGHTMTYFVVWDMFCGWAAYDQHTHFIAETTDGKFLDVREPWGEFHPFGNLGRVQYDVTTVMPSRHIAHILERTEHPEIDRVFIVQEMWPKQYNMPGHIWDHYYGEPPDKTTYHHLRAVCNADGTPIAAYPDWIAQQRLNSIADNPRLQREVQQAQLSMNTLYTPRNQSQSRTAAGRPATN